MHILSRQFQLPSRARPRGFTLIELLVVIGIIVVLISILLPAINAARRQGLLVVCASNQRQIVAASLMHANEHQGFVQLVGDLQTLRGPLPAAVNDIPQRRYTFVPWSLVERDLALVPYHAAIARYCGCPIPVNTADNVDNWLNLPTALKKIFSCPASNRIDLVPPAGQGTLVVAPLDGFGQIYAWSTNGDYVLNEGFTGFSTTPPNDLRRLRGNLSHAHPTSAIVLLADGQPRPEPAIWFMPEGWVTWTPTDPNGTVTLADAWLDRTRAKKRTLSKDNFDPLRHKDRINVAYLDGHVENLMLTPQGLSGAILIK